MPFGKCILVVKTGCVLLHKEEKRSVCFIVFLRSKAYNKCFWREGTLNMISLAFRLKLVVEVSARCEYKVVRNRT